MITQPFARASHLISFLLAVVALAASACTRRHAANGILRIRDRQRPREPDRDAVRARRPAVRLRAGRAAARDQERRAAATPFLTLTVSSSGERGLLGVAFDPAFATNQFVYVYYTATTPTVHNRISRFTANGDVAVAGSEVVIFELDNLSSATNHNGGALAFGPDGKLYAAVGENANGANAQSMTNVLGKMLRLNADGSIPTDNPFFSTATGTEPRDLGARPAQPVHVRLQSRTAPSCSSTTWARTRGRRSTTGAPAPTTGGRRPKGRQRDPRFVGPRLRLQPQRSGACAITGGAFYSPLTAQFPADYVGDYFFADYCGGWIRKLDPAAGNSVASFATGIASPVDLKVSDDGSLYYLARGAGSATGVVYRIALRRIGAHHHDAPVEPHRPARRLGHLQRARVGPAAAAVPVAAQRRRHRRRDRAGPTRIASVAAVRQRRAVPGEWSATISATCSATRRC